METNTKLSTQAKKEKNGFTLIEVIAVLVLLGILAAVAVPKYINMADEARGAAIDAGIAELNSREAVIWGKESLKSSGWASDILPDTDVGVQYTGTLTVTGGTLIFQSKTDQVLVRAAASVNRPGYWTKG